MRGKLIRDKLQLRVTAMNCALIPFREQASYYDLSSVTSTLLVSGVSVRCHTLTRESSAADSSYKHKQMVT